MAAADGSGAMAGDGPCSPATGKRLRRSLAVAMVWAIPLLVLLVAWQGWKWREHAYRLPAWPMVAEGHAAKLVQAANDVLHADDPKPGDNPWDNVFVPEMQIVGGRMTPEQKRIADSVKYPTEAEMAAAKSVAAARKARVRRAAQAAFHAALAQPSFFNEPVDPKARISVEKEYAVSRAAQTLCEQGLVLAKQGEERRGVELCLDAVAAGLALERGSRETVARQGATMLDGVIAELMAYRFVSPATAKAACQRLEGLLETAPTAGQKLAWQLPVMAAKAGSPQALPKFSFATYAQRHGQDRVARDPLPGEQGSLNRLWWQARAEHTRACLTILTSPPPRVRYEQSLAWLRDLAKELDKPYIEQRRPAAVGREWADQRFSMSYEARVGTCAQACLPRLLLAHLAAKAYQLDHGRPPAKLADLVPTYLRRVPDDPFVRGPLRGKRQGDTFVVYSVGPDGQDDDGRPWAQTQRATNGRRLFVVPGHGAKGDIVAP